MPIYIVQVIVLECHEDNALINAIPPPTPLPGQGGDLSLREVPKMHPRGLNFWLIPYNPPTNPLHNLGVVENLLTKAPLLGQESDALIPTIAQEGGGGGIALIGA